MLGPKLATIPQEVACPYSIRRFSGVLFGMLVLIRNYAPTQTAGPPRRAALTLPAAFVTPLVQGCYARGQQA